LKQCLSKVCSPFLRTMEAEQRTVTSLAFLLTFCQQRRLQSETGYSIITFYPQPASSYLTSLW
jgi:hypothetical protein